MPRLRVFISYSRRDLGVVSALADDLAALGHDVWFDQALVGGQFWWDSILDEIARCDLFIFVVSPVSVLSQVCKLELEYAALLCRNLLPVRVAEGVDYSALPIVLLPIQVTDYDATNRVGAIQLARSLSLFDNRPALPASMPPRPQLPNNSSRMGAILYSSEQEGSFGSWSAFCSPERVGGEFRLSERSANRPAIVELNARQNQCVGINKSTSLLSGIVSFEYRVPNTARVGDHIYFAMIPIREPSFKRPGIVEVGSKEQNAPENAVSRFRKRYVAPAVTQASGAWADASIEFDFSKLDGAFYSVFAPRLNEGAKSPQAAKLALRNVRVFSNN